jgi:hypothetical protein
MTIVAVIIKTFAAFGYGQVIIVAPGSSYIKKVGPSFSGTDTLTVNALHFLVIVLVRHLYKFLAVKELLWFGCTPFSLLGRGFRSSHKYRDVFDIPKPAKKSFAGVKISQKAHFKQAKLSSIPAVFLLLLLTGIKACVITVKPQQLLVCSLLHNSPVFQDHYLIKTEQ